jgi:hypothetical protein
MQLRFSNQMLTHILEQSMLLNCVCPAQVCKAINEQRTLYAYQERCLNNNETDKAVHQRIAETLRATHAQLEQCLYDILSLERWDLETCDMPDELRDKLLSEFD